MYIDFWHTIGYVIIATEAFHRPQIPLFFPKPGKKNGRHHSHKRPSLRSLNGAHSVGLKPYGDSYQISLGKTTQLKKFMKVHEIWWKNAPINLSDRLGTFLCSPGQVEVPETTLTYTQSASNIQISETRCGTFDPNDYTLKESRRAILYIFAPWWRFFLYFMVKIVTAHKESNRIEEVREVFCRILKRWFISWITRQNPIW